MIAKIPPKRSDGKTNFRALSEYIADAEKTRGVVWTYNTLDPDTAASEMTASALLNTRVKDPAFHAVLSWPEGERPTPAQARAAGEEALKALGFDLEEGGHQAMIALHLDTDNIHIHLAANRVHPEHGKAVDLWKSKERLHSACREIELAQGWSHDRGLAEVVQDDQGKDHVVPSGYRNADKAGLSNRVQDLEAVTGGISFERYVRDTVGPALRAGVKSGDWQQVHQALARYGVELVKRGGGFALRDTQQPEQYHAKGATAGSWAKAARLEKALGAYQGPNDKAQRTRAELRYREGEIERIEDAKDQRPKATNEPTSDRKPRNRDPDSKRIRKAERDALRRRFEREKAAGWDGYAREKKQAFKAAKRAADAKRQALKQEMQRIREKTWRIRRVQPAAERLAPAVVRSLLAMDYAQRREALAEELGQERQGLREQWEQRRGELRRQSWRAWVRAQAEQGDEAAKRALRGLRYRDQEHAASVRPGDPEGQGAQDAASARRHMRDLEARIEARSVVYADQVGEVMRDHGERIDLLRVDEQAGDQALKLAAAKWGGKVQLSGSAAWVERTARQAARLGIEVTGEGRRAWQDEREQQTRRPPAPSFSAARRLDAGELTALKRGIDLVALAGRFGWTVDAKESTRASVKLRRGEDAALIVQRRAEGDGFFVADDSANGDAISFYRHETGQSFRQAVAELGTMAGIARRAAPAPIRASAKPGPDVTAARQRYATGAKPEGDHAYVQGRGIPPAVLRQAQDVRIDRQWGNLLFAHRDSAGNVTGYEYKGAQAGGFAAGGRRQLYATGEGEDPARIVIVESGLEALSKQALDGRGDTLYVSIGGALAAHQLTRIKALARRHPSAEVIAAFAADQGGEEYTAQVRAAVRRAWDGRAELEKGQDWNGRLRQEQKRQSERQRGRGGPGLERSRPARR